MKHLTTFIAAVISFAAAAQQMPYNPDANGDDFVGVDDVLGVLGVFDTALMQPDLQCDYEGTDLEAFFGGIFNDEIVLDSIYVEYSFSDSVATFIAGCPDPVMIETVLERSFLLTELTTDLNADPLNVNAQTTYLDHYRQLSLRFYPMEGWYRLEYLDSEAAVLTSYGQFSVWVGHSVPIPFDESWQLTEDGIEVAWVDGGFLGNCQSVRIIPFWHEAE